VWKQGIHYQQGGTVPSHVASIEPKVKDSYSLGVAKPVELRL
jgi:hypothetical protein